MNRGWEEFQDVFSKFFLEKVCITIPVLQMRKLKVIESKLLGSKSVSERNKIGTETFLGLIPTFCLSQCINITPPHARVTYAF